MTQKLMLIDGHALAYRAHYALLNKGFTTKEGIPTWAVYGFTKMMLEVVEKIHPDLLAVTFDKSAPTFRHEAFAEYKAHRKPMPDGLSEQIDRIRELVRAFGIPIYELPGYEADDVIGTISRQAEKAGYEVLIVTGDRDSLQLVDDQVSVLLPDQAESIKRYGPKEVEEKYGFKPAQVIDYKALRGDPSDNIPGVPGIGDKTATKLIQEFGTFDNLYAHLDEVKPPRIQEKLRENKELADQSKFLATIDTNVPLEGLDWTHCQMSKPNLEELTQVLEKLEFTTIQRQLPKILANFGMDGVAVPTEENIKPLGVKTRIVREMGVLEAIAQDLQKCALVAFDVETDSLRSLDTKLVGISLAYGIPDACECEAVYIPVGHNEGDQLPLETVINTLKPLLEDPILQKIAHNAKFDINVLSEYGINVKGLHFDTMIADYLVDPSHNHGLKDLAWEYLHYQMTPIVDLIGTGAKAITMREVPIEKAADYAASDAAVALELADHLMTKLAELKLTRLFGEIEIPLVSVLACIEQNGIRIDTDYLKGLSIRLEEAIHSLEEQIYGLAGTRFNIGSPKQLANVLFEQLGLPIIKKTKTGPSTDASVLEELADRHQVVALILEYRQLAKLKSTYIDALPELLNPRDCRIHTSFNQTVAATGRLSSSDPNLQNIPVRTELGREIRAAFLPLEANHLILSADYSQIELRILAHLSQDPAFMDAYRNDRDIHTLTATQIFQVAPENVTSDMRRIAKTVNFGVVYGQSPFGLAKTLGIPQKEARRFIEAFYEHYQGVIRYNEQMVEEARRKGYVTTMLGRRRYLPELMSPNRTQRDLGERMAINTPIQGSAADLIKIAMINVDQQLRKRGLETRMILQVHDELVFDVPPQELEEVRQLVEHEMSHAMDLSIPLQVSIHSGRNWGEAK